MIQQMNLARISVVLLLGATVAHAQKTTEIFIPIGKSPGLSGKHTLLGTVSSVAAQARQVTLSDSAGSYNVTISEDTKIWLDRSKLKMTNIKGDFSDIADGLAAEVKFRDNDREKEAEWIKVQVAEPPGG